MLWPRFCNLLLLLLNILRYWHMFLLLYFFNLNWMMTRSLLFFFKYWNFFKLFRVILTYYFFIFIIDFFSLHFIFVLCWGNSISNMMIVDSNIFHILKLLKVLIIVRVFEDLNTEILFIFEVIIIYFFRLRFRWLIIFLYCWVLGERALNWCWRLDSFWMLRLSVWSSHTWFFRCSVWLYCFRTIWFLWSCLWRLWWKLLRRVSLLLSGLLFWHTWCW